MTENESIILNIQSIHSEKIYSGIKIFELRKSIPNYAPKVVYLFEQKKKTISGAFFVDQILNEQIDRLWEHVGTSGTSKERFYEYFEGYTKGYAYKITKAIKFNDEITFEEIISVEPTFYHPQSFIYLKKFPSLKKKLQESLESTLERINTSISFCSPDENEEKIFKDLALLEISQNYDDIEESFSENIVRTSKLGFDPEGYFTSKKQLYSIKSNFRLIGFIVLTEKLGNSIKTGPTILLPEFRHKGLGSIIRTKIENEYRSKGFRKIYCTCNALDNSIVKYLLRSEMRIEAHLFNHYKLNHSELIFGKLLNSQQKVNSKFLRSRSKAINVEIFKNKDHHEISEFLISHFSKSYFIIDESFTQRLFKIHKKSTNNYAIKPKIIFYSKTNYGRIMTVAICSPKRGGSIKLTYITYTNNTESFNVTIKEIISYFKEQKRKIFTTIAIKDYQLIESFENIGFIKEGLLLEPYKDGVDMLVLSFFL